MGPTAILMNTVTVTPSAYQDLLARLKTQIRTAQVHAALAVNQTLVLLYWGIGNEILARQKQDGWGKP